MIVGDLMTTLERYFRLKPGLGLILLHFVYRTPPFVYQGLHIVMLMSTILLFLGLSRSNELTALKAGGVSLYRVSLPVFGLAGLVTVARSAFQELVMPFMNRRAVEVDEARIKRRTMPELRKRAADLVPGAGGRGGGEPHLPHRPPRSRQPADERRHGPVAGLGLRHAATLGRAGDALVGRRGRLAPGATGSGASSGPASPTGRRRSGSRPSGCPSGTRTSPRCREPPT